MKNPLLLALAVALIVTGALGISISMWYAGKQMTEYRAIPMDMMRKRMMSRGQMKDMMSGMVPPGIKPENLPEPDSRGAKLLTRYCAQCHDLPSPFTHSGEEWPIIAGRMFARTSMMSGMMDIENPSPEEKETIVSYLKKHSMKSISPSQLPAPGSESAILFTEKCSQCHSLPDPKMHRPEQWPAVVERMRANMKSMGRTVITEDEKKTIADYLLSNAK